MADSVRWPGLDTPGALPNDFQQNGYSEGAINNLIKTSMNNGPDKRRQRTTETYQPIAGSMILTTNQRATFISFYKSDTAFGAIPVVMRAPGTLVDEMTAYIDAQTITPVSGKAWRLTLTLRVRIE